VIQGTVTADETPVILLATAGQTRTAIIDTGFNGDLELPEALRAHVNPRPRGYSLSALAGGQSILEQMYLVDFPFDGRIVQAEASFVAGSEILIGTGLLRDYRLEIDFPNGTVQLTRTRGALTNP
jgi:predicted aspartyl protease